MKKLTARDQFWLNHVEACAKSQMSQSDYCKKHGLNIKSFSARKSIYRNSKRKIATGSQDLFIPLNGDKSTIRITLSTGIELTFDKIPDPSWMGSVLHSLGASNDQNKII